MAASSPTRTAPRPSPRAAADALFSKIPDAGVSAAPGAVLAAAQPGRLPPLPSNLAPTVVTDTACPHRVELLYVTPMMARELHELNFQGQRNVSPDHVAYLAETIRRDTFDGGEALRICCLEDHRFLVNGQHRLLAIMKAGNGVWMAFVWTICATMTQVVEIYSRLDRGRMRGLGTVLSVRAADDPVDLPEARLIYVSRAGVLLENGLKRLHHSSYESRSPDYRFDLLRKYAQPAAVYFSFVERLPAQLDRMLRKRAPVLACGIATTIHQREKARRFWTAVARDDGLSQGDPAKTLVEYLKVYPTGFHSAKVDPEVFKAVALCWNAFYAGQPLRYIRMNQMDEPFLLGTPYAGTPA